MKTFEMTRAQLRAAIAEKRGECTHTEVKRAWGANGRMEVCVRCGFDTRSGLTDETDYLGSMDAALPLLREMPMAGLDYYESDLVTLTWSDDDGDIHGVDDERGNEAEAVAVALAWWQWKTGEIVELVSE